MSMGAEELSKFSSYQMLKEDKNWNIYVGLKKAQQNLMVDVTANNKCLSC
jgi:N-acetylmuramic acid 6-phosphate (MurNAc-6-P) etherase